MYDVECIRRDFPILSRKVHGHPTVYLDNAATTQKLQSVIDAIVDFYRCSNANVHRGVHTLGEEATEAYEGTRARVARFIGAASPDEIVDTRGTTGAKLVASASGRRELRPGDEIVLTQLEHHSNIVPWQLVAQATGARVRWIPIDADGRLDLDAADACIGDATRLVAVTQMSNVLGTITPARTIAQLAHARRPHHTDPLSRVDAEAKGTNPICGDDVSIQLRLDGARSLKPVSKARVAL